MSKIHDEVLIGTKYGYLTVLSEPFKIDVGYRIKKFVEAKCDCGKLFNAYLYGIKTGEVISCGCGIRLIKHGQNTHPLYRVWTAMKGRCYAKNSTSYKNYGARGISVCDEWRNDFGIFLNWAIENGWQKGLHIDRINNDGNYCQSNCRFITLLENNENRRNTLRITYNGKTKLLTEWAADYGLNYNILRKDIFVKKMDIGYALNRKVKHHKANKLIEFNGEQKTLTEWCNFYNINLKCVWNRLYNKKWSLKDSLTIPIYKSPKK